MSLGRIELSQLAINLQENRLGQVLGLACIAHDAQGRCMDKALVASEKDCKCVVIAQLHLPGELLITAGEQARVWDVVGSAVRSLPGKIHL